MVLNRPKLFQNVKILKENINGEIEEYASKVESIEKDNLFLVHTPIRKSEMVMLLNDTVITVTYMVEKKGMYKFDAKVIEKVRKGKITFIRIKRISDIVENQRRQFFRIETNFKVDLKRKDSEEIEHVASLDISAGGMKVYTDRKIELGDILDTYFSLDETKMYIETKVVKKVRNDNIRNRWEISLEFLNLSEKERESIIRFVFEKEREKIKREYLQNDK